MECHDVYAAAWVLVNALMLGAIADDITGGTDLASVLRRRSLRVVQTIGPPPSTLPPSDAVVVSLKTRTAPVAVATAAAIDAQNALRNAGATQIFFKYCSTFDSTDQGNIGPVTDVLMQELGVPFTIACPAYPALGRTVYAGHLFVHGELLSESSMRSHPLTPMRDANLVRVLARQSRSPISLVALSQVEAGAKVLRHRFGELSRSSGGIAIVDALFDRHIDSLADAAESLALVTGGAALGGDLARWHGGRVSPSAASSSNAAILDRPTPVPPPGRRVAILSGSCSAATQSQVSRIRDLICSRALDPVALAEDPGELGRIIEWMQAHGRQGPVLLYSTARPDQVAASQAQLGREESSRILESAIGDVARALAADGVRTFIVAGGETSGAVLQALGIRALSFGDDIDAGVPWTQSVDPPGFAFALKSGNFGSAEFFLRALSASGDQSAGVRAP